MPAGLGAEITGVDLAGPVSDEVHARIVDAWHQYLVLRIRGQRLDDAQLMRFGRRFGELELSPSTEYTANFGEMEGVPPEVTVVSNIVEDGKALGTLGAGEAYWHSDSSFIDKPPSASILYGIEVPDSGGDTCFANMYAAYEALPDDVKARIDGLRAIHSSAYTSAGALRKGRTAPADVTQDPGPRHPLVRTHPETGRKALYLGRRLNSYIVGLPIAESEALLDLLWSHATREEFTWRHQWQRGDVLIWDNRCALHRRDAFDPSVRRLMHRVQVKGTTPV
ncbi:TauD/TfdA family dioxygenase [Pigmentiphaga soli]|uniref:TauD/TfdA family dioxygenase n=2 Tax=Pigmentiphaga soli TaxID=1007095 RepID=A0ABP8H5B8_9BURK